MYERLSKAEEDIAKHDNELGALGHKVENVIMPELESLKKVNKNHESEISKANTEILAVKNALNSFELTVMKDGQHTRDLLNQFVQHYFSADGKAMMTREKTALMKLSGKEKIWLAVIAMLSGGGITAVVTIVTTYLNQQ